MRVVIVSKALVVSAYRQKLVELARLGLDVVAVVPPEWREGGAVRRLERDATDGYRLIVSPMRWNGHFHFHYYPRLAALLTSVRPDVVHIDEEPYNLATYLAAREATRLHIPYVFFTWQNLMRRYPPPFAQFERAVYRGSAHALAGSEEAGEVLRAKGYVGTLSIVPQFGVDPDIFAPGDSPPRPFTVGFLNRLVAAKDPLLLLNAFKHLPGDARLVVAGDGPMRSAVEVAIDDAGLRPRVSMLRHVPSNQMPDLVRGLDAVALPSRTTGRWKEQFGRVLIEAMSTGVPVVASNSGEIPRVVGDAGLIVPEGDAAAFSKALRRLYDDRELARELGRRGRERVQCQFTHAGIAARTLRAYEDTVR